MKRREDLSTPRAAARVGVSYDSDRFGAFSESIANFLGTGRFLVWQTFVITAWILLNTAVPEEFQFDPWSRGLVLLTLVLSIQASYAAPLILLAQSRQERRDRVTAKNDRDVAERTQADTEFLAREIASVRLSLSDMVTGEALDDKLERLSDVVERLADQVAQLTIGDDDTRASRARRSGSHGFALILRSESTPVNSCSRTPTALTVRRSATVSSDGSPARITPGSRRPSTAADANAMAVAAVAVPTSSAAPAISVHRPPDSSLPRTSTRTAPTPPSRCGGLSIGSHAVNRSRRLADTRALMRPASGKASCNSTGDESSAR